MRNQQRIIVAARELFATQGLDITLDLVAEHAGVGVGTVYRRFANKQELIVAAVEESVRELAEQAELALHHPDPWLGIVQFFGYACEHLAVNRGLSEMVRTQENGEDSAIKCVRERLEPAVLSIVERATDAGVLRDGIDTSDFFALIHMVDAVAVFASPVNQTVWRRYFEIVLDGLRADGRPRYPITTAPLTTEEIHDAKLACFNQRR